MKEFTCRYCGHVSKDHYEHGNHFNECPKLAPLREAAMSLKNPPPEQWAKSDFLFCAGCAHSASRLDYPGAPSGETACMACVRNVNKDQDLAGVEALIGERWPHHSGDNYITLEGLHRAMEAAGR